MATLQELALDFRSVGYGGGGGFTLFGVTKSLDTTLNISTRLRHYKARLLNVIIKYFSDKALNSGLRSEESTRQPLQPQNRQNTDLNHSNCSLLLTDDHSSLQEAVVGEGLAFRRQCPANKESCFLDGKDQNSSASTGVAGLLLIEQCFALRANIREQCLKMLPVS